LAWISNRVDSSKRVKNEKNKDGEAESDGQLKRKLRDATGAFENALKLRALRRAKYILRLYVTGSSARSLRAVHNLKKICEEYFPNDYDLEVIDIYKDPAAARDEQIIAAPTGCCSKNAHVPAKQLSHNKAQEAQMIIYHLYFFVPFCGDYRAVDVLDGPDAFLMYLSYHAR
jgi:circadian clock protein KaiB